MGYLKDWHHKKKGHTLLRCTCEQSMKLKKKHNRHTLITDIRPVLNCSTPLPSLLGSKFWASAYACSHTAHGSIQKCYKTIPNCV